MSSRRWSVVVVGLLALGACSDDGGQQTAAGSADASTEPAGSTAGSTDGSTEPAGSTDGTVGGETSAGPAVTVGSAPETVPLPECAVEPDAEPDGWPFRSPPEIGVIEFAQDDLTYSVVGVTNDAEAVLVGTMERSFPDFEVLEPSGGESDVSVEFEALVGEASLSLEDPDGDGCWDVEIEAAYFEPPPPASSESDQSSGDDTIGEVADDPLDELPSVGSGEVITARGAFPIQVSRCDVGEEISIVGASDAGEVSVETADDGAVRLSWVYADEVEILDDDAKVLAVTATGGVVVGDGEGPDGPETVIAEFTC